MVAKTYSMGLYGMEAFPVEVEADLSQGLPAFELVGLPDAAVKESRDRVRSALKNRGFDFPVSRITMNLAPADKKKEGPIYDLPLFISLLKASQQLACPTDDAIFLGELSLSGELRPIRGVLPMADKAREAGFRRLYVPVENAAEGAVIQGLEVYGIRDVEQLLAHLQGKVKLSPAEARYGEREGTEFLDFADVKGQPEAKRALEIAASGSHNVLLIGPPGSGKSLMSKCLASILPPMTRDEAVETSMIYSVAGLLPEDSGLLTYRPYRAPHHTASPAAVVGGGTRAMPGEISLAHNGVLCLDEIAQFPPSVLDVLRQPLEDRKIVVSRTRYKVTWPAAFMLVASMNPCPCGYAGEDDGRCTCSAGMIHRYRSRVSGPLLDRIDLNINVRAVDSAAMSYNPAQEGSREIAARVSRAREVQLRRFAGLEIRTNAGMEPCHIREFCRIGEDGERLLRRLMDSYGLSARGYVRVLRVARTIADMSGSENIKIAHISEAVQYRFPENV